MNRKNVIIASGVVLVLVIIIVLAIMMRGDSPTGSRSTDVSGPIKASTPATQKPAQALVAQGDTSTPNAQAVKTAYDAYLQYQNSTESPSRSGGLEAVRSYLTDDLYNKLKTNYATGSTQDKFLCAQDVPSATVAGSSSQNPAIVTVVEQFGQTMPKHTVTTDDAYKISGITCS